jgi:hypothetical protein
MVPSASATKRDTGILEALTLKIRLLCVEQAAATWWPGVRSGVSQARARLDGLVAAGTLARHEVFCHPLLPLEAPVLVWRPGEPQPTEDVFGAVAYRLKTRWPDEPPARTVVYTATPKLANRLGGFNGRMRHRDQVTHDLHVTQLYLEFLRRDPEAARRWRGEELGKSEQGYGEKLPDAVLVDDAGRPCLAIEFGGRYSKGRVRDFYLHCAGRGIGFDLW